MWQVYEAFWHFWEQENRPRKEFVRFNLWGCSKGQVNFVHRAFSILFFKGKPGDEVEDKPLETLRSRFFGISQQTSRSHVTSALPSVLWFEVHVCSRSRSRGK